MAEDNNDTIQQKVAEAVKHTADLQDRLRASEADAKASRDQVASLFHDLEKADAAIERLSRERDYWMKHSVELSTKLASAISLLQTIAHDAEQEAQRPTLRRSAPPVAVDLDQLSDDIGRLAAQSTEQQK